MVIALGGPTQFNINPIALEFCYQLGIAIMMTCASTLVIAWKEISVVKLTTELAVTGNWPLYLAYTVPLLLSAGITGAVGGISYSHYLIAWRFNLTFWAVWIPCVVALCVRYGWLTYQRLRDAGDKISMRQQLITFFILNVTLANGWVVIVLHTIFAIQIDASDVYWSLVNCCYRGFLFILQIGLAAYAWFGTSTLVERAQSKSDTRSPANSNHSPDKSSGSK